MTATMPTTPTKAQRIAHLFLNGYSLDVISERGLQGGWTRREAEQVAEANGWELNCNGRIPAELRTTPPAPPAAQVPTSPPAPAQPATDPVAVGKRHPSPAVRKLADRAETALAKLREALTAEQERDTIRRRLAELDAERERLRRQLTGKPTPTAAASGKAKAAPSGPQRPINHGTWGGYMAHTKRGETACGDCEKAKDDQLAALRAKKAGA